MSRKFQGISETSGRGNHVNLMSDFRVPVPFQSDRVNLLANPKWQKNAKNNNLHIVWADSVLKINRKDGKVIITEGRVPMQVSFLVHSSGWHAVCGGKMKEEGLSPLPPSSRNASCDILPRFRDDWKLVRATSTARVS